MSETENNNGSKRKRVMAGAFSGTNLALAGGHNQRATLQAIRVKSPITRLELAEMTGLTAPAIANITKKLIGDGLIAEVGRVRGGRGQPAKMLAINPDGCYSIGVNIDRDHITIVALDLLGRVRARTTHEVDFALPAAVAKLFKNETDYFFKKVGIPKEKVIGIGVALPDDLGRIALPKQPASYSIWSDTDIEALFTKIIDLPTYVENDATAAAIGETHFGLGLQHPSFFYILVTWGLGGGVVIDEVYYRGATGRSGEIGFLSVDAGEKGVKALQDVVSLSALYEYLEDRGYAIDAPSDIDDLQPEISPLLESWAELAAGYMLDSLIALNCLLNPGAVLIGGRLPAVVADTLTGKLEAKLRADPGVTPFLSPVRKAAIAEDAPAVGAAILPFSDMLFPTRAALLKPTG